MEPCNLVSKVKTWASPHQVAIHLLQTRARVLQMIQCINAFTSISSSVKALPWVLTNSTTASRSPSPEQIGWQRILAFPWGKCPWKAFFILFPVVCSSSVPPRLMSICQFYNNRLTFGKIGATNITFCFIFKCLNIFLQIKFRFIQNLILCRRGQIYFQAKNSIRKSFIFAGVGGPHLDSNLKLSLWFQFLGEQFLSTHHILGISTKGSNTGAWLDLLDVRPEWR